MYLFMISSYALMLINLITITLMGLSGYFNFDILGANHSRFAVFMILVFGITETIVMYFFISTGKGIKLAIEDGLGSPELWKREKKLKMKLFPHLMLTITLIGSVFIHGGAVDNRLSIAWMHGPLFLIAFTHHLYSLYIKNNAFKEQIDIISELDPVEKPD